MEVDTMSVKQMKEELAALGVSADDCIEREDVQAKLRAARQAKSQTPQTAAGRRAVGAMIREAIRLGVPIYNNGDQRGCAEIYRECCEDILDLQGGLDGENRVAVREVLRKLASLPSDDARAWQLRHTLDAVLAGGLSSSLTSTATTSTATPSLSHAFEEEKALSSPSAAGGDYQKSF
jgi:hypothetical protein